MWRILAWTIGLAVVAAAQLMPTVPSTEADDKVLHTVLYLLLVIGLTITAPLRWGTPMERVRVATSISIIAGVLLEALQTFVPGRTFDAADLAANMFGCLLGWIVSWGMMEGWGERSVASK